MKRKFFVRTRKEVADFFGVSLGAVDKWRERKMPGGGGRWDLGAMARWLLKRAEEERKCRKGRSESDPEYRLKRYRADLTRLRLLEERKKLMRVEDHDSHLMKLCLLFRDRLLGLAAGLGAQLEGLSAADRGSMIEDRCREILEDLGGGAQGDEEDRPGPARGELVQVVIPAGPPAPAPIDGEPVGGGVPSSGAGEPDPRPLEESARSLPC